MVRNTCADRFGNFGASTGVKMQRIPPENAGNVAFCRERKRVTVYGFCHPLRRGCAHRHIDSSCSMILRSAGRLSYQWKRGSAGSIWEISMWWHRDGIAASDMFNACHLPRVLSSFLCVLCSAYLLLSREKTQDHLAPMCDVLTGLYHGETAPSCSRESHFKHLSMKRGTQLTVYGYLCT